MRDAMGGKSIGRLGREREPLDLTFDYFDDVTIRIHPYATDQVEVDFMRAARELDESEIASVDAAAFEQAPPEEQVRLLRTLSRVEQAGVRAVVSALEQLIHPDDFDRYWKLGAEHGQLLRDRMADIRAITEAVLEAATDFPTGRPGGSPRGQVSTPDSSEVASPSAPLLPHGTDLERAMALERGRPDIQEFFVMEMEAREQAEQDQRDAAARDRAALERAGLSAG